VAGIVIAVRQHSPQAMLAEAMSVAIATGALGWAANTANDLHGGGALLADLAQRLAVAVAPAVFFHLLMTLPEGRLVRPSHRRVIVVAYALGAATGLALLADRDSVAVWPVVLLWICALSALPVAHAHYLAASVKDRRRMQWLGWAAVVAAEVAVVSVALSLVTGWPRHDGVIALAASGLVPAALVASTVPRLLARVDRLLTHTVALAGLTVLIVSAYLLALAAFGRKPNGSERSLLLLSMLASAGAALACVVDGPRQSRRLWRTRVARRSVAHVGHAPDTRHTTRRVAVAAGRSAAQVDAVAQRTDLDRRRRALRGGRDGAAPATRAVLRR
jgi:hypothetical protein